MERLEILQKIKKELIIYKEYLLSLLNNNQSKDDDKKLIKK